MLKRDNPVLTHKWLSNEAILLVLVGVVGYAVSTVFELNGDLKSVVVGSSILITFLLVSYLRRGVSFVSDDIGKKYMRERVGISQVYNNLDDCREDMRHDFASASRIKLLLQIGRKEFGDGQSSFFWDLAGDKKGSADVSVQILRASPDSPFLSARRAKSRGTPVERWREDIRRLENQISLLRDTYNCTYVKEQVHSEPFLWRIFIFDEVAYVSGYLHKRDNDVKAFVYRLEEGPHSLFQVFDKYFDYLWMKYDSEHDGDLEAKWETWE